ncbi:MULTISPECIES: type II toxin-antitoxin system RelE/ParE family toxin [unclassified Caulobacter]|uniref:type II toxin-antitoxin system RelE/ParE family toxin n=1 Tax=unclassified Caulobacter TaxID=2648921 RepID=UPI0009EA28DE|nr:MULTISPECIES: type II toxin-antitoxin system RelE/ParE family toxin [unclassified Caulobacter]
MPAAILAPGARRDVLNAARIIARDNVSAARRLPRTVVALAQRIGDFPDIGIERLDLASPPYRFVALPGFPHIVVYDAARRPPVILRILHGSRDLQSILKNLPHRGS